MVQDRSDEVLSPNLLAVEDEAESKEPRAARKAAKKSRKLARAGGVEPIAAVQNVGEVRSIGKYCMSRVLI